ncbi:MAG: hypothetical protein ACPL7M_16160, partial [Bryobacteraceae bacterium]
ANAGRRLRDGQNEEVLVRLYRVLELLGQMRLFSHGIDSGRTDPGDARVRAWLETLPPQRRPAPNEDGFLELSRQKAAELLHFIEEKSGNAGGLEIAGKLTNLDWLGDWGPTMRNTSVLIHGFRARSRGREAELRGLLERLTQLYSGESESNAALLAACQFGFLHGL